MPTGVADERDNARVINNTAAIVARFRESTVSAPPANDNLANPLALGGASGTFNGSNNGATKEEGEPYHAFRLGGASVWFSWQAPENGPVTLTTAGSTFNTVPAVRLEEFLNDTQRIGRGVVVNQGAWQAQLESNKQAYALEFVQRPRFLAAYPSNMPPAQFVEALRANTGAALSQAETNELAAELTADNTAAGRASVLRRVAEDADLQTAERNRAFVLMEFFGYLRRNPNDAPDTDFTGWKFWLDKLDEFNGNFVDAELVKAFITSIEYRQRFGP